MFQHDGRDPADPLQLVSTHIVNPVPNGKGLKGAWTQQYACTPQAGDSSLEGLCFSALAQGFRPQEIAPDLGTRPEVSTWEQLFKTPQTEFIRSLQHERATSRLERPVGIKGEGPALAFNSTSLKTLIGDCREKAIALLTLYYPIYQASFPDPDERLPFKTLLKLIQDRRFSVNIDVLTSEQGIIGGYQTHVATIEGETYSFGDYLCIHDDMKGMGVANLVYRSTIERRRSSFGAIAHFGEVNDPYLMDAAQQAIDRKSGTDPETRLKFWSRQGRKMLDVPWIQPATAPGLAPVEYMMLTIHHLDESKPLRLTGETVMSAWDAYYQPLADVAPVQETRLEMERLLESYRGREIQLLPLGTRRSFISQA